MPAGRSCVWWGVYVYPFGAVLDRSARRVAQVRFTACLAGLQRKTGVRANGFESRLAHRDIVAIATFVGGRVSHVPTPVPTAQKGAEMATWRNSLKAARDEVGDTSPIVAIAPDNESVLDVRFHGGYGASEGPPVLIWTEDRVYFPVVYDGSEWLGSAPRNPIGAGQQHVGGE